MKTLDPRLEAALLAFGRQPGLTPEQFSQLHMALIADDQRLEQLNSQARAGYLTAFRVEAPNAVPRRAGHYDAANGVITLPAGCFRGGSTVPSDDLKVTLALQTMVINFAHDTFADTHGTRARVAPLMAEHLQDVINGSPALVNEVKRSIREGRLERFAVLDPTKGAGGTYDDAKKSMNLTWHSLTDSAAPSLYEDKKAFDLTFVIGHEIQHSFNHAMRQDAWNVFQDEIERIAKSRQSEHVYSPAMRALLHDTRRDEGRAQLAGWNALASRAAEQHLPMTFEGIYGMTEFRARDFLELDSGTMVASPWPGFTFNSDLTLADTPENIDAAAKTFFDRPAVAHQVPGAPPVLTTGLGFHAESDYVNYYGRAGVERIVAAEDKFVPESRREETKLVLDMGGMGLDRRLIERLGLMIKDQRSHRYYDSSQPEAAPLYFHHTLGGSDDHQFVPSSTIAPDAKTAVPQASVTAPSSIIVEDVRSLQAQLNALGVTDHRGRPIPEHGVYDLPTRFAVMGFQQEHGLPMSGVPDTATLALVISTAPQERRQSALETMAPPSAAMNSSPSAPERRHAARHPEALSMPSKLASPYGTDDPRHPDSPTHVLYNQLHDRIPEASERRLLQFAAACHAQGITGKNLGEILFNEDKGIMAFASTGFPRHITSVDLHGPLPTPDQAVQQIQQRDQYVVQFNEQILNARIASQAQQGFVLG